ncbi:MAG: hypothetical protein V4622_12400 [Bacteroidota bacterium]
MNKILFITSIFITFFTFSQDEIESDEMGVRFLTQKIGNIDERFYYETEKPTEEMKYASKMKGEKVYVYKKRKGLSVFTEKGFLFYKELSNLKNFPTDYGVVESFIYADKIYTLIYKKEENIANLKIIELNSNLEIINNNLLSFDLMTTIEEIDLKNFENQVAIISKKAINKNNSTIVETVGIDLLKSEIQKSNVSITTENNVILSDFIINKDLIINAAFYSIEESNFNKLDKFTTLFIKFDELNSVTSNYDYKSNKDFIPKSYKFLKINENEYFIGSLAIPIEGAQAGYFISKNSFGSKIDFNTNSVIKATDYLKDENWSNFDQKLISKAKCPIKYSKEFLTDFFLFDGKLNFISVPKHSETEASTEFEGDLTFASFNQNGYKSIDFFKTKERRSSLSYTSFMLPNYLYLLNKDEIVFYFIPIAFSDEYGYSRKELGVLALGTGNPISYSFNFKTKTKVYKKIETNDETTYNTIGLDFFYKENLCLLKANLFKTNIEKFQIESIPIITQ